MISYRLIFVLLVFVFVASSATGQNLFPNPGFEEYSQCPDKLSQSKRCKGWDGWARNSPDYYNCGYYEQDFTGFPYAFPSSGTGVMGFVNLSNEGSGGVPIGTYTEGITCKLLQPMKAGRNYQLRFHLAIASQGIAGPVEFGEELAFGFYFYNKDSRPEWNGAGTGGWKANSFTPQASVLASAIDTYDRYKVFTFCFRATEDCDSAYVGAVSTPVTLELPNKTYYFNLDDISLIEAPEATLDAVLSADSICRNGCVALNISDTINLSGLTCYAPGSNYDSSQQAPFQLCYDRAGIFPVSLTLNRDGTCSTFRWQDSILVSEPAQPELRDTTLCPGQILTVNLRRFETSRLVWSDGDTTHLKRFDAAGQYSVSLETGGCKSVAAFSLNVREHCIGEVSVPSAFSPNGDALNDVFRVLSVYPLDNFSIRIYNRWGQSVFYNTNYRAGWDGYKADAGTYFYLISYQHPISGEIISLKGDVSLIR